MDPAHPSVAKTTLFPAVTMNMSGSDATIGELRAAGSLKWTAFPDALGAFVAEMDFGLAPAIADALRDAVDASITGYLPGALVERLGTSTAALMERRYGWQVDPAKVHPLGDVLAGLEVAIEYFSAPDAPVIVPTPAYMPFLPLPPTLGRGVIEVPAATVDGTPTLDLAGIDAAFAAGANLLVLCNPVNPLGRVLTRDELTAVGEIVDRHGGRVFADEVHAPLVYPGAEHIPYASVSPATAAHTITATSASKAWNVAGLKCAQCILSNDADEAAWASASVRARHGASTMGVVANIAAYESGESWLEETIGYLDSNRRALGALLAEHLPEVRYAAPEGTYIGWLDCRALELDEPPAAFFARAAGVALTDGALCGAGGEGHVRLVFATPREVLEEMVLRMSAAVHAR